jgi:hypothetical protein
MRELNALARALMRDAGRYGDDVDLACGTFAAGDCACAVRRRPRLGVRPGFVRAYALGNRSDRDGTAGARNPCSVVGP